MLNYYDEIKNSILEEIEEEENVKDILKSSDCKEEIIENLIDYFWIDDFVTGNASGSYYFSSYKAKKHCYNFFRDVFEALEDYDYKKELQNFKTFIRLVEEGYLNIETMTINYELLDEVDGDIIFYEFEEIENLNFETLDVITRCYFLSSVLSDVLDNILD